MYKGVMGTHNIAFCSYLYGGSDISSLWHRGWGAGHSESTWREELSWNYATKLIEISRNFHNIVNQLGFNKN